MSKIKGYAIFLCLFGILLDQLSKKWALQLPTLYLNHGLVFGLLDDTPDFIRIVALSSLAGFVLSGYLFTLFMLSSKTSILIYGISLVVAGVIGNVMDKFFFGYTVDFIPFKFYHLYYAFNLADVLQFTGSMIVIWCLCKKDPLIWSKNLKMRRILIKPRDQIRLALRFTCVAFCSSIVLGLFCYTFFSTFTRSTGTHKHLVIFIYSYALIALFFCLLVFLAGIIISQRTFGPIYAFEKYVENLNQNGDTPLKLREGDEFKSLEIVAEKLRTEFKKKD